MGTSASRCWGNDPVDRTVRLLESLAAKQKRVEQPVLSNEASEG